MWEPVTQNILRVVSIVTILKLPTAFHVEFRFSFIVVSFEHVYISRGQVVLQIC